jgi:hypothetical protein
VQCFQPNPDKWKLTITHQDYDTDIKIKPDRQPGKFQNSYRFYGFWVSPTAEQETAPSPKRPILHKTLFQNLPMNDF